MTAMFVVRCNVSVCPIPSILVSLTPACRLSEGLAAALPPGIHLITLLLSPFHPTQPSPVQRAETWLRELRCDWLSWTDLIDGLLEERAMVREGELVL